MAQPTIVAYKATETPEYLTLQASAGYAGVSVDTLRRRVRFGHLKAYRSGPTTNSRILVRRADLDAMLTVIPTIGTVGL